MVLKCQSVDELPCKTATHLSVIESQMKGINEYLVYNSCSADTRSVSTGGIKKSDSDFQ